MKSISLLYFYLYVHRQDAQFYLIIQPPPEKNSVIREWIRASLINMMHLTPRLDSVFHGELDQQIPQLLHQMTQAHQQCLIHGIFCRCK